MRRYDIRLLLNRFTPLAIQEQQPFDPIKAEDIPQRHARMCVISAAVPVGLTEGCDM